MFIHRATRWDLEVLKQDKYFKMMTNMIYPQNRGNINQKESEQWQRQLRATQ